MIRDMKINLALRFKNPKFWVQIAVAVFTPIFAYFNIAGSEITSFQILFETVGKAILNPYLLVVVAASVWNAIEDPTTTGFSDTAEVLESNEPFN